MSDETSELQAQVTALQGQVGDLERKVSELQGQMEAPQSVSGDIDEDADIGFPVGGPGP